MPARNKKKAPVISYPDSPPVRIEPGIICGDFAYVKTPSDGWMPARIVFILSYEEVVVECYGVKEAHFTALTANIRTFDNPPPPPPKSEKERLAAFNTAVANATAELNSGSFVHTTPECPLCNQVRAESLMCDWCPYSYCADCTAAQRKGVDPEADWRCPKCEEGVAIYAAKLYPYMADCASQCKHDDSANLFSVPVAEAYPQLAASYAEVIKNPMDFRTLTEKVAAKEYEGVKPFGDALCSIFDNAVTFNDSSSAVVADALKLRVKAAAHLRELRRKLRCDVTADGATSRVDRRWISVVEDEWEPVVLPDEPVEEAAAGGGGASIAEGGALARVMGDAQLRKRFEALTANDGAGCVGVSERLIAAYLCYDAGGGVSTFPRALSAKTVLETAASALEDALSPSSKGSRSKRLSMFSSSGWGGGAAAATGVTSDSAVAAATVCGVDAAQIKATCSDLVRQLNETVAAGRLVTKAERDALAEAREKGGGRRSKAPAEAADLLGPPHAVRLLLLTAPRLAAMAEEGAADPALAAMRAIGHAIDDQYANIIPEFEPVQAASVMGAFSA